MGQTPRGKPHIYVPMPAPEGTYPEDSQRKMNKRDVLIRRYGEVSVMHAEVAVCVNVIIGLGFLKKSEFVGMVEQALAVADIRRQRQAESGGREG